MENRLKGLRNSMQKTTFNQLNFTEQHQKDIREKLKKHEASDEEIVFAMMQLLVNEKTGYEIAKQLRSRGIEKFENNEGFLYTFLHRLERTGMLQTSWNKSEAKYYKLNDKGRKTLQKAERKQMKRQVVMKELLEG